MDDVCKNIGEYSPNKKHKISVAFDNVITIFLVITSSKATALVFITQSYFSAPKNIRLNITHYFIMKINENLHLIAFNHSSDIDFKDFMNLYKQCTTKPYSFLVIDATLPSDDPSHFRENLLERI